MRTISDKKINIVCLCLIVLFAMLLMVRSLFGPIWYHEIDTSTIKAEIIKQQNRRQALLKNIASSLKFSLQEFKQPKPFIIPHTLQTQHFVKPMIIFYHFDDKNFS